VVGGQWAHVALCAFRVKNFDCQRTEGVSTKRDRRRCLRKSGQTRRRPQAVAGPPPRPTTKYGRICRRNPQGRGHFSPALRRSSLRYTRYLSLLASRSEQKWLPSPAVPLCRYTLLSRTSDAGCRCHSSASRKLGWEATRVPTNGLGRAGGCEGKMKRPPDGRPSQRLLLRLQTSKFLYSFLLSEYQVGYIVVPTLLGRFGVEVACYERRLLWWANIPGRKVY
jgi:hypothetical protein